MVASKFVVTVIILNFTTVYNIIGIIFMTLKELLGTVITNYNFYKPMQFLYLKKQWFKAK